MPWKVDDILEWQCPKFPNSKARWRVVGCFYGATGQESLIEMECLTHTAGWTGEWEWHPRVFVPEPLTRVLKLVQPATPTEDYP